MSDSSEDFVKDLQAQYGDPGHDMSHPMAPWGGGLLQKGFEYGGAFARGALKQAADAPGLRAIEPKAIADWAKETDTAHPDVEGAGRYVTPASVVLGRLPDLPALAATATASMPVRMASKFAQNAWKGAAGGAAETNVDTPSGDEAGRRVARGAAEGAGTTVALGAGQAALRAMPYWLLPAAIAGGELMHGRFLPWHIRHAMGMALHSIAARASKIPAGLVGAGGEAAAQQGGFEPGGSETQRPEPF